MLQYTYMEEQTKKGCPFDLNGETEFNWSGADIDPSEFMTAGYSRIISILDKPEIDTRPAFEALRCFACGNLWAVEYSFPDHPPLLLSARLVEVSERKEFFIDMQRALLKQYGENRIGPVYV